MDSLFFIDTGGKEDTSDQEESDNNAEELVEDKVMGAMDAATEARLRQRAIKERSLASFLFGKPKESGHYEERSDNDDEGVESDKEDTEENSEEEKEGDEEEDDGNEVTISSAQPTFSGEK